MGNLLLDQKPLVILPELAVQVGLNEAIILQQIHYWLKKDKVGKVHDGRKWVRNTYDQWTENFPFWSKTTVRRAIKRLRDKGLLLVTRLNDKAYDKTNWYSIDYDRLSKMTSPSVHNGQADLPKMDTPIPETTPETTPDNSQGGTNDVPTNLGDWLDVVRESNNRPATLRWMISVVYPYYKEQDLPDYGYIGKAAREVDGAGYLAKLIWENAKHAPQGNLISYILKAHRNGGNHDNGRNRSRSRGTSQGSGIPPLPPGRTRPWSKKELAWIQRERELEAEGKLG